MDCPQLSNHSPSSPGPSPGEGRKGLRDAIKNHGIAMIGEFSGTYMFLFFAFAGTQIAVTSTKASTPSEAVAAAPNTPNLLYISLSFGFSLAVNVWAVYRVSGGMLNPAVTLGLCLVKAIPAIRGLLLFPCQLLAGIAAAGVVSALFPGPLSVEVTLGAGTSIVQGVFIEMFLTAQLVFVVLMLAVEKHRATFMAPIGIGLSLFIAHLAGVYYTGAGINPARVLGPEVINASFVGYTWIYWVGPFLGSLLAVTLYYILNLLKYQSGAPGQDSGNEVICLLYPDEESAISANPQTSKHFVLHRKYSLYPYKALGRAFANSSV
ncbi:aquaporin-like protein [Lepidopterella palustris CBS 459.81]|uniref:Aquaporin-like protein n=1 Tax=Lepidopterella palustris CBS 459.81 TaxID=1314670 RepID=A0A8E2J9L2_9PEZI|nr:aquaporin-like protein [Lepidopterella palustris CBS 459.81]